MKIGYFASLFPYHDSFQDVGLSRQYPIGGAEIWAYHLAHQMASLGHDITVFTSSVDSKNHIEEQDGIKIYRYGTNFKIEKAFFSIDLLVKSLQHDIDIAHLHYTLPPGNIASLFYAKMKRKPLVVTYHGDAVPNYGKLIRRVGVGLQDKFVVPMILANAKFITCNSVYYIPISHFLPKYQEKVIAVPPGVNVNEFSVPYTREECRERLSLHKDDKIILFFGHLINYKSPDLLIKAMPAIIKKTPNARLVIAGGGPLREELERLTSDLHLTQIIKFAGKVTDDVKALYYNAADVFVLPSTTTGESFGIVLLEAASVGLPIVVSSLDTFRAFIRDGYNGLVANLGDIDSLAQTINRLLSNEELMAEIGKNARASVIDYSWEHIAQKVEKIYEQVLSRKT